MLIQISFNCFFNQKVFQHHHHQQNWGFTKKKTSAVFSVSVTELSFPDEIEKTETVAFEPSVETAFN